MLKKTVTYTDFNDNESTEDFYFNLTKAELIDMEFDRGGLAKYLIKVSQSGDNRLIWNAFKEIVEASIGVRSEDGKRFIKNQEVLDDFRQSPAYSEVIFAIASNAESAADFVNGVIPKDMRGATVSKEKFDEVTGGDEKLWEQMKASAPQIVEGETVEEENSSQSEAPNSEAIAAYLKANPDAMQNYLK